MPDIPLDIPYPEVLRIRQAAERAHEDIRWLVGDHENVASILLHLATESWRAGRDHGAERDI